MGATGELLPPTAPIAVANLGRSKANIPIARVHKARRPLPLLLNGRLLPSLRNHLLLLLLLQNPCFCSCGSSADKDDDENNKTPSLRLLCLVVVVVVVAVD